MDNARRSINEGGHRRAAPIGIGGLKRARDSARPVAVESYRFTPDDLAVETRPPGISAFMRVKNGADFVEAAIRSHLPHVDEIVVVMNQCTDATPEIVARLVAEFGPRRLPTYHYLPKVFPPGSEGHCSEPSDSPRSFVNMSNFALTRTRYSVAVKLDDDHVAMGDRVARLTKAIRASACRLDRLMCFSGINLARDDHGWFGVLNREPFVGTGDHFYFEVGPQTHFTHDPRFEGFCSGGRPRTFEDFAYWHLKYLKAGHGFANRDIDEGMNQRFARKRDSFLAGRHVVSLDDLAGHRRMRAPSMPAAVMPEKRRIARDRWRRFVADGPRDADLTELFFNDLARLSPARL